MDIILKILIGPAAVFTLLIASCGNPSSVDSSTNPVDSIITDNQGTVGAEYMNAFLGEFALCKKDDDGYYRQMPCQNYLPSVLIGQYGASEGEWYIGVELFHGYEYAVREAKPSEKGVIILATNVDNNEEVEITLVEDEEGIFKMGGITFPDGEYLIYKESVENYPTRYCTDVETIMGLLDLSWTPLKEQDDGSFIIYEECMYGSGSIDFDKDGSMVHFSGGGDQMSCHITGMNMKDGYINIWYTDDMYGEAGTLTFDLNPYESKISVTGESSWIISAYYVPSSLVDDFEVVKEEPCDE